MTQVSSLYLHIPFCRHLCNYCDFYKRQYEPKSHQFEDFHRFLLDSFKRHESLMQQEDVIWAPLKTLYFGGGTPSLWGTEGAQFFEENLRARLPMTTDVEWTMEVDPGSWDPKSIAAWKTLGLNRISIGTQTLDPTFLKIMDRVHSLDETFELLDFCQSEAWNFSLDFLLGLPFSREKKRNIEGELERFLHYGPKHVSLYILNARSKYPHIQHLPDDEFIREEYLFVSEYLLKKGFHHYEVSNFALPGFESRHNLKYWRGESVAALGPTGTGYFARHSQSALRYKWKVTSAEFEIEELGPSELMLEKAYLSLRTTDGYVHPTLTPSAEELFAKWMKLGYGIWEEKKMTLNSQGFVILDSLMDDIFRLPAP